MAIVHEDLDNAVVFHLSGHLNAASAPAAEQAMQDSIAAGRANLLADLRDLGYISSAGIQAFINVAVACRAEGGDLRLVSPAPIVAKVLDLSGVSQSIQVFETLDEAVASFS